MNPTQLLEHFDRITEVPGSVSDLRALIIHLGVTGKLVQHEDEGLYGDAFHLKIQEGIARLAAGCNRCRWRASNRVAPKEAPFSIPDHWTWARINDTGLYINGIAFKPTDWKIEGLPIIRIQNLSDETKEFNYVEGSFADENLIRYGDLLVSWSATLDAFLWHRADGVLNQHIFKVIVNEDAVARNYLYWLLKHEIKSLADSDHAHGLAMKHINRGPFLAHLIPIPPLAEQHRIVAKIDELMVLCDQLEAAKTEREAQRGRLVAASLNRIGTAPAAADEAATEAQSATPLRDATRFHLDHLPRLTTRPEHIKQLRQTILNLAVRGRLVPQDPNDESAAELLDRIQFEKAQRQGDKTTRGKSNLERDEITEFRVPLGWVLTDLGSVALKITDGTHKTPTYVDSGIPFVSVKDFSSGKLSLSNTRFITRHEHEVLYRRCDPKRGDILIGRIGTLGKAVLVDTDIEFSLFVSVGLIRFSHGYIAPEFFRLVLNSPFVESEFDRIKVGGGTHTNKLNLGDLHTVAFPLPPLAEQFRIIAKVDELMALCDQLEAQLTAAQSGSRRLLEAVLHEALAAAA
jgi:type I restriction enzyme S subunit